MARITTGQMYQEWKDMNAKLNSQIILQQTIIQRQLDMIERLDGIITGDTPANTQLTGSNVEEIMLYDSVAITDTNNVARKIDLSKYKSILILASSTLDQDPTLTIYAPGYSQIRTFSNDSWISENTVTIDSAAWHLINSKIKWLDTHSFKELNFIAKCNIAPTKGSLTVRVWGVVN